MKHIALIALLSCAPLPALAHKVIAGVFASGDVIEGELGFSNGTMAADTPVAVTTPDGRVLGETVTDADGFFTFRPTEATAHRFYADLGAGHVAEVIMPAEEVAAILGQPVPVTPVQTASPLQTADAAPLTEAQTRAVAEAVRAEIRPLRREIAAYKERNDLQTILGGIGYIFGLFGLGFYIAARRKVDG
ncbi:cobalt ABC transporter permease [Sagittula sp. SSi028]|uniref:cobalt ABC transporter permease n=1 Tax=Sagittula sp. SSi028 TaxID=3400636 RepID=UPI003AF431D5